MPRPHRLFAVLCILVLLAGALLAPVAGGRASGVLVPLALLFGLVVIAIVREIDDCAPIAPLAFPSLPPRAPPRPLSAI